MGKKKAKTKAEKADLKAAKAAAKWREHPVVRAAGWVSEIADQPQLLSLCAGTLAVGLMRRDARLTSTGARMLASAVVAIAAKDMAKRAIDRTRPGVVVDGGQYRLRKGSGTGDGELGSFPSGHTAGAVAVARAAARGYPGIVPAATAAAGLIAVVQVPRCAHYPTDIGAGAVIGWLAEAAVTVGEGLIRRGEPVAID